MTLIVCPLSHVTRLVKERGPSHLVTLMDPGSLPDTPDGILADRHLRIGVNDICDPTEGLLLPDEALVVQLLEFGRTWDEAAPMLIHCWAGISRSSASAFVLACERNPHADEAAIARGLRAASAIATPNRRIVALADDHLGRGGRMVDAVDRIGRGPAAFENTPFEIAARY